MSFFIIFICQAQVQNKGISPRYAALGFKPGLNGLSHSVPFQSPQTSLVTTWQSPCPAESAVGRAAPESGGCRGWSSFRRDRGFIPKVLSTCIVNQSSPEAEANKDPEG